MIHHTSFPHFYFFIVNLTALIPKCLLSHKDLRGLYTLQFYIVWESQQTLLLKKTNSQHILQLKAILFVSNSTTHVHFSLGKKIKSCSLIIWGGKTHNMGFPPENPGINTPAPPKNVVPAHIHVTSSKAIDYSIHLVWPQVVVVNCWSGLSTFYKLILDFSQQVWVSHPQQVKTKDWLYTGTLSWIM